MTRVALLYNEPVLPTDHPDYASEAGVLESVEAFSRALAKSDDEIVRIGLSASLPELIARLSRDRPNVVVNFCEGFGGHARGEIHITGILELVGLPYTGSTPESLALALDKVRSKQVLTAAGVPTAAYWFIRRCDDLERMLIARDLRDRLATGPLFVKPAAEDASLGIDEHSVVVNSRALFEKVKSLQTRFGDVLVEPYLDGREFNVGVIALPEPCALPIAEIEFQADSELPWPIVTYDGKWTAGSRDCRATPVRCPAAIDKALARRIEKTALAAFGAIGCRDYARVDLRVTRGGELYVLEVNANPDAGPGAGLARALAAAGISYDAFARQLVETAASRGPNLEKRGEGEKGRGGDLEATSPGSSPPPPLSKFPPLSRGCRAPASIKTRALRPDDPPALIGLLEACQMFRADEIDVAREILDEAIRDGAQGHYQVLVAECDGRPVGWSCHGRVPLTDATYDLYWIAVHPEFQGRRVGRALLSEIEQSLRPVEGRWLVAETSSSDAYSHTRAFYERSGFALVGDVPDFYRAGDGRITFAKRLH
jgi:D-alanine-D-alanine ligase